MPLPSFKEFLELPIQVQHTWDCYPIVDEALIDLEQGQFMQAALLADAVYTDDRVSAVLSTRSNALFGLPMSFKYQGQDSADSKAAPGTNEEAENAEVTALKIKVRDRVEKLWNQMFPVAALKEQVINGWLLNCGLGELIWTWTADGEYLPTLKTWNSQFLYWRWDTRSYWLIHQGGQTQVFPGNGRWVLLSPFGHNHGWLRGLIRSLGKLWLDRVFAQRDWARANEKYALGIVKAWEPADGSLPDKTAFRAATRNMASETTVSLPVTAAGNKFDVEMMKTDPMTGAENFERRLKNLDTCIAICVLGQNLSTEVSGSSGSRAAAKVHDNVRGDYLKNDVEVVSSLIGTQVLSPFVRYNYEHDAQALGLDWRELVPEVTWIVDPPDDKKADSEAIANIASAVPGLLGTDADIRALLEKYDIPVTEERAAGDRPPPGNDVNERPRAPGGVEDEDGLPSDPDSTNEPTNPNGDEPSEQPLLTTANRKVPPGLKPGARRGQAFADDLAENAARAAKGSLDPLRKQLMDICLSASSYEEIRTKTRELYLHSGKSPAALREIVANAVIVGQLVGRLSAHQDVRGGK
jgi:phage gp29-like protein